MTWRLNNKEGVSCSGEASFCAFIQGSVEDLANLGLPSPAVELPATGVMMLAFPRSPEAVPVTRSSCHPDLKPLYSNKSPCFPKVQLTPGF